MFNRQSFYASEKDGNDTVSSSHNIVYCFEDTLVILFCLQPENVMSNRIKILLNMTYVITASFLIQ